MLNSTKCFTQWKLHHSHLRIFLWNELQTIFFSLNFTIFFICRNIQNFLFWRLQSQKKKYFLAGLRGLSFYKLGICESEWDSWFEHKVWVWVLTLYKEILVWASALRLSVILHSSVWKVHQSFFLQFLCEINFGEITSAKCAIFSHFVVLNFDLSEFLHFLKAEIYQMNKIQSS